MIVKVAVVNDYPLVVAGLHAMLAPFSARVHLAETEVNLPVTLQVDVVLQDTFGHPRVPLPEPRRVIGSHRAKLIVFSWDSSDARVRAAMAGGADGYVSKAASPARLVDAIERVHRGERVLRGADGSEPGCLGRWPGDEHGLSGRESEVLALICQGLSNADISQLAFIGINTVKTYVRSTYRKIGVATRPQAVIWGLSHGFRPEQTQRELHRRAGS